MSISINFFLDSPSDNEALVINLMILQTPVDYVLST